MYSLVILLLIVVTHHTTFPTSGISHSLYHQSGQYQLHSTSVEFKGVLKYFCVVKILLRYLGNSVTFIMLYKLSTRCPDSLVSLLYHSLLLQRC